MQTQSDDRVRVVSRRNLGAMCERVSSMCHRYWIHKVTRSRVHVAYSNPNEYGSERPIFAVFPCYPSGWRDDSDPNQTPNPRIVLDAVRVYGGRGDEYDPIQDFTILLDCPEMWWNPEDGTWKTREEIEAEQAKQAGR